MTLLTVALFMQQCMLTLTHKLTETHGGDISSVENHFHEAIISIFVVSEQFFNAVSQLTSTTNLYGQCAY